MVIVVPKSSARSVLSGANCRSWSSCEIGISLPLTRTLVSGPSVLLTSWSYWIRSVRLKLPPFKRVCVMRASSFPRVTASGGPTVDGLAQPCRALPDPGLRVLGTVPGKRVVERPPRRRGIAERQVALGGVQRNERVAVAQLGRDRERLEREAVTPEPLARGREPQP